MQQRKSYNRDSKFPILKRYTEMQTSEGMFPSMETQEMKEEGEDIKWLQGTMTQRNSQAWGKKKSAF